MERVEHVVDRFGNDHHPQRCRKHDESEQLDDLPYLALQHTEVPFRELSGYQWDRCCGHPDRQRNDDHDQFVGVETEQSEQIFDFFAGVIRQVLHHRLERHLIDQLGESDA
ncbi:hypothetical protein SDC9_104750 [bioreactor metagenome]|uniref:Uncharacterized protein n=1 Tax=bioreactor metagenome TaxID=1076179 RepID=A0A645B035_9ZZZZ